MFSIFKRAIFNRPPRSKRQIFSYWNGLEKVYADPIAISSRLDTHPVYRPDLHPEMAEQDSPEGIKAFEICLSAYRDAFDLPAYDPKTGKGLTTAEVLELHATFCLYLQYLKKNIEATLMRQGVTEPTSTTSAKPIMSDTSDTSSTNNDKSIEESTNSESPSSSQS